MALLIRLVTDFKKLMIGSLTERTQHLITRNRQYKRVHPVPINMTREGPVAVQLFDDALHFNTHWLAGKIGHGEEFCLTRSKRFKQVIIHQDANPADIGRSLGGPFRFRLILNLKEGGHLTIQVGRKKKKEQEKRL